MAPCWSLRASPSLAPCWSLLATWTSAPYPSHNVLMSLHLCPITCCSEVTAFNCRLGCCRKQAPKQEVLRNMCQEGMVRGRSTAFPKLVMIDNG